MITDWETWYGWLDAAAAANEYTEPIADAVGRIGATPAGEDAAGTDFNRTGTWEAAGLLEEGWTWCRRPDGDRGFLTRPGKGHGVSASVGTCTSSKNGWPLFWCFSTSTNFQPDTPYTRFGVYATLRHGGDYQAAAKELRQQGYGSRPPETPTPTFGTPRVAAQPGGRLFKWMSELELRPESDKWLWKGYLSRGGLTVLSALWKSGKSTLLSHLLRACDGRASEFLGREIIPFRVLYISEEHEELWAERRDELGIRDHVGIVSRPFRGRASPAQWSEFIKKTADAVLRYQFDLVVFDTISKMWPARDENDAGQVEEALMPLWAVTGTGAAALLVHHNRKSGGKDFTGMRGSGGLPAFAETLIEFGRHSESNKDRKRVLNSSGRYRESTAKILVELQGSGYVCVNNDWEEPTPTFGGQSSGPVVNGRTISRLDARVLEVLPDEPERAVSLNGIATALYGRGGFVRKEERQSYIHELIRAGLALCDAEEGGYYRTPLGREHAGSRGSAPSDAREPPHGNHHENGSAGSRNRPEPPGAGK